MKKDRIVTRSFRIQAQVLNLPSTKLLWINTYFPTDPQRMANYDDTELLEVLGQVETIINSVAYNDVLWTGDINWDMRRNTEFSRIMHGFVERMGLVTLWSQHEVDYTHIHTDNKSTSIVDHFILSPRLLPLVADCGVIHRGDNLSRHSPIWVKLNLGTLPLRKESAGSIPRKPSWPKATVEHVSGYTAALQDRLEILQVPQSMHCTNPQCRDQQHSQDRDSFTLDILLSLVETTHTTLSLSGGR